MEMAAPEVELVLDASPSAFATFYEKALPGIYGYFFHRCGASAALAEDLTQETFLAAVVELQKGKQVRAPIAWIHGIARHKLLDHYRRVQRVERQVTLDSASEEVGEELVVADAADARDHVMAALGAVVASQRAALVLCYIDGYSVPEAAQLLGKSAEAVESLLARGRHGFKRAYLEGRP
ncbi:MAG: RNA polymerase sigma factor [Streptosporangiaceae bacterium]